MKQTWVSAIVVLAASFYAGPSAAAENEKQEAPTPVRTETKSNVSTAEPPAPVYRPPMRGAPGGRVGGGTRGTDRSVFVLSVLAPDHTGLTINEQPALYWYVSSVVSSPVEVTMLDPRITNPVLQIRLTPPIAAGVHRIQLADHAVRLEPGVNYRWYVAVIPDANRRSKDLLAGGAIERIAASAELRTKLSRSSGIEASSVYAEAGLWYDAIATLTSLIEAAPKDAMLLRQRAQLLGQVGLPEIGD